MDTSHRLVLLIAILTFKSKYSFTTICAHLHRVTQLMFRICVTETLCDHLHYWVFLANRQSVLQASEPIRSEEKINP